MIERVCTHPNEQANPFEAPVPDQSAVLKSVSAPSGADLLVFEETRGPHNHMNLNSQKLNRRFSIYTPSFYSSWMLPSPLPAPW
jgi:hypothetical protein